MNDHLLTAANTFDEFTTFNIVNNTREMDKHFLEDVLDGLTQPQKTLPCKYFYDEIGSKLFEKICDLDEYYITRTELALLDCIGHELSVKIGRNAVIIEPGAGAGLKIRKLFGLLDSPQLYVPMDISKDFLLYSAQIIQNEFPEIEVHPIEGDFTQPIKWFDSANPNKIIFFPGSTIGNFEQEKAIEFLANMKNLMGENGALIIGVDQIKDRRVLISAYDDASGITAEFNKNLLVRINTELDGNFDLSEFEHKAIFDESRSRIEMYLVSKKNQNVSVDGHHFSFSKGETIHTENSHKYSNESFLNLALRAGLKSVKSWTDKNQYFRIYYLTSAPDKSSQ